jgi:NAD(P)-dependent dehydrogenase (short-subunit alcohol dehydrogenase family)/acyl carrier protein
MRELVRAQRDVLLGYFGSPVEPGLPAPVTATIEAKPIAAVADKPVPTAAPASAVAALPEALDLEGLLLRIVAERTGYPADKLDVDLDLEADLSIDSIKRVEVIGELAQRLRLRDQAGAHSDALLEQLAALKTLRSMLALLREMMPSANGGARAATLLPEIVSQCTGYPLEALDLDLDLEADLSIDSIKRVEIVGRLAERLGVDPGQHKDAVLEQLSALKTLRAMIEWTDAHIGGVAETPAATPAASPANDTAFPLQRYVIRQRDARPLGGKVLDLTGQHFVITDDRLGIAPVLASTLEACGALVKVVEFAELETSPDIPSRIDGLVHLWSLNPASRVCDVKRFFTLARETLLQGAGHLLVAGAGASPSRGGGFAGMVKTLAKEFPALRARWLELDPAEPAAVLASYVENELLSDEGLAEVGYRSGKRLVQDIVPVDLDRQGLDGVPIDRDSVVLLIGGARGITAGLAVALARRYRCHLELAGRSELPEAPEDPATREIVDPKMLRQALVAANPGLRPAQIEAMARRLLAEREIRRTLEEVRQAGSTVHYTAIDVRDDERFADLIADVYERRGRIDGVIHGAGVVEDKLVRDKTPESFSRVFDTKVNPAMMLRKLIREDVRFVVFFSSVAAAFGNRGQVDYASANDVLDKVARSWQSRIKGRVLSINWGPWAGTGMVSESLRDEYHRRGIGLIPQSAGIDALLRELSAPGEDSQVVLMCGTPESFGARSSPLAGAA